MSPHTVIRAALVVVALALAACGDAAPAATSGASAAPTSGQTGAAVDRGVAVVLRGVPVKSGDGAVEWCPGFPADDDACPGITVTGLSDRDRVALDGPPRPMRIDGVYDGVTLTATGSPEPFALPSEDPPILCRDLRGTPDPDPGLDGGGNMDPDASAAITRYTRTIPDRYAGTWWNSDTQVMTVWLTGDDVGEHRSALTEAVGDRGTVCVAGGARWTLRELQTASDRAFEIAIDADLLPWGAGVHESGNVAEVEVERSDPATLERIAAVTDGAVDVRAFLSVRDATLADLPEPSQRGDIVLETDDRRGGPGMAALGSFTVRFDAQRQCVYGEMGTDRVGIVWPFGYYAKRDPVRVFDADGMLVARAGDVLSSGGGESDRSGPPVCATDHTWVVSDRPEVVGDPTPVPGDHS